MRDWGHARDFVEAQWLMLQQAEPEDYVIATGEQHSVREFVTLAGENLGMRIEWQGNAESEVGIDSVTGRTVVRVDQRYFRPAEVDTLLGDPSKAREKLGWTPKTAFGDLVKEMVEGDLELARRDSLVSREGFTVYTHHE